jgi:transcriptional regulator with XRE-family HTH domain
MPKKKHKTVSSQEESFGERLARLRKQAGFTQQELGEQLGISQRMVAYYEGQTDRAPDHLLATLADLLGVSTDVLLGVRTPAAASPKPNNQRLWRRFKEIEKLPVRERKQILALVDAMLERHRLLQKAS